MRWIGISRRSGVTRRFGKAVRGAFYQKCFNLDAFFLFLKVSVMEVFAAYTNFAAAMVDFSALQAGGYDPVLRDLHQCTMSPFHIYAYGGIKIDLPRDQLSEAADYLADIQTQPITDFDPIISKDRRTFILTVLATFGFFPLYAFLICLPFLIFIDVRLAELLARTEVYIVLMLGLCLMAISLHARFKVIPAMKANRMRLDATPS
jgi:hypothetical protein